MIKGISFFIPSTFSRSVSSTFHCFTSFESLYSRFPTCAASFSIAVTSISLNLPYFHPAIFASHSSHIPHTTCSSSNSFSVVAVSLFGGACSGGRSGTSGGERVREVRGCARVVASGTRRNRVPRSRRS